MGGQGRHCGIALLGAVEASYGDRGGRGQCGRRWWGPSRRRGRVPLLMLRNTSDRYRAYVDTCGCGGEVVTVGGCPGGTLGSFLMRQGGLLGILL